MDIMYGSASTSLPSSYSFQYICGEGCVGICVLGLRDVDGGVEGKLLFGVCARRSVRRVKYWESKGSKSVLVKLLGLLNIS